MSGAFCLVVNPAARDGRSLRLLPAVLGALAGGPAKVAVRQATGLRHAASVAHDAAARGETVVAVGGDGLVGCLASAVAGAGGDLGIIPAGRGNDFARALGIPARPAAAAALLLAGHRRPVDLIGARVGDGPEHVVAGSVYLGVPSEGGEIVNNRRLLPGTAGYQLAGARALLGWQPAMFTVRHTGTGHHEAAGFRGFCVVVANSAYLAAGKKAAPAADVSDGMLDVIMIGGRGKLSFARVMLMAGSGAHVRLSQVRTARAASVTVTTDRPMPAGADGETLPSAAPLTPGSPLHIRVLPHAVRMITPAASASPGYTG